MAMDMTNNPTLKYLFRNGKNFDSKKLLSIGTNPLSLLSSFSEEYLQHYVEDINKDRYLPLSNLHQLNKRNILWNVSFILESEQVTTQHICFKLLWIIQDFIISELN